MTSSSHTVQLESRNCNQKCSKYVSDIHDVSTKNDENKNHHRFHEDQQQTDIESRSENAQISNLSSLSNVSNVSNVQNASNEPASDFLNELKELKALKDSNELHWHKMSNMSSVPPKTLDSYPSIPSAQPVDSVYQRIEMQIDGHSDDSPNEISLNPQKRNSLNTSKYDHSTTEPVEDTMRPSKRRKKEKNTEHFFEMKKNNSKKELRITPLRPQFTERNSHALLSFCPNLYHTVSCKHEVFKDYFTALSEQVFDLNDIEKEIEFRFRLDKDMKISDAYIGLVFLSTKEDESKDVCKNVFKDEEIHHMSDDEGNLNDDQKLRLNSKQSKTSENIGDIVNEDKEKTFINKDHMILDEQNDSPQSQNRLCRSYNSGDDKFSLSHHVGETRNSYGLWCFDSSIWNNKIRRQKSYNNNSELLEGGTYERIPRGSLLQMSVNKISVEGDTHQLGILWKVDQGEWFGFDGNLHPFAQIRSNIRRFRIGISFGMSGIQVSSLK